MKQVTISLFRRMMREARHFNDYNFRAYAIRRVRTGFEKNRNLEGYVSTRFCFFVFSLSCARLFVSHHFCSSPLVLIGHTIEAWCKNRNGTFLFTESERRRKDLFLRTIIVVETIIRNVLQVWVDSSACPQITDILTELNCSQKDLSICPTQHVIKS